MTIAQYYNNAKNLNESQLAAVKALCMSAGKEQLLQARKDMGFGGPRSDLNSRDKLANWVYAQIKDRKYSYDRLSQ